MHQSRLLLGFGFVFHRTSTDGNLATGVLTRMGIGDVLLKPRMRCRLRNPRRLARPVPPFLPRKIERFPVYYGRVLQTARVAPTQRPSVQESSLGQVLSENQETACRWDGESGRRPYKRGNNYRALEKRDGQAYEEFAHQFQKRREKPLENSEESISGL